MREPPDLPPDDAVGRVRARWSLPAEMVTFLPVGNDSNAWAFRLDGDGGPWFLKAIAGPVNVAGVTVPVFLAERGITRVVPPIPTVDGAPFDRGAPFSFVVMPFLAGTHAGERALTRAQRVELGRTLRAIHDLDLSDGVMRALPRERFVAGDVADLRRVDERVRRSAPRDRIDARFARVWSDRRATILAAVERTERLGRAARARPRDLVLCHADVHRWNVMVSPSDELTLVDWDEAVLAPRERDLMFVDGGVGALDPDGPAFFEGYGAIAIDPVLIAYYRYSWLVEEFADYGRRVYLMPGVGDETRAGAIGYLEEMFEPGAVVDAAARADAALAGSGQSFPRR